MGYLHIENLYRPQAQIILLFREVFALEKIHGTSTNISWRDGKLALFSGGLKPDVFAALFDTDDLIRRFPELGHADVTVFGEGYGGKCQGMSATYGKATRFVAFEVKIGETWLSVPNAEDVATKLGLEFVHWTKISTDIETLDAERDKPSVQAKRNGIVEDKMREGIVLRPLQEFYDNAGNRVIAKHKNAAFSERKTKVPVDQAERQKFEDAQSVALEFVTEMRMSHVLDKLGNPNDVAATGAVIKAMVADVLREGSGEFDDNKAVRKAIGAATATMFKQRVCNLKGRFK